jgi:Zn-dependent protease
MLTIPGKIPIHIYPFFWLLILMIGWINTNTLAGTMIWAVVILVSVLLHEFGHALTANFFGQRAEISLVGMGGLTTRQGAPLRKWKEFLIVLNGPLVGLLLFAVLYLFIPKELANPYLNYGLNVAIEVNLFWTILNLLPVWPLDGGHLLRIVLEGAFGFKGIKGAFLLSLFFAGAVGIIFIIFQQLLVGAVFLMLAFESYRGWSDIKEVNPQDASMDLQKELKDALQDVNAGRQDQALSKLMGLREQVKSGVIFVAATENIARIYVEKGQYKQAYEWLRPVQNQLSNEYLVLFQSLAYRLEEWEEAAQIGVKAYQRAPSIDVALINAFSYAVMGMVNPAIGWLRCAAQLGYPSLSSVVQKREFDSIRHKPEFEAWLKTIE